MQGLRIQLSNERGGDWPWIQQERWHLWAGQEPFPWHGENIYLIGVGSIKNKKRKTGDSKDRLVLSIAVQEAEKRGNSWSGNQVKGGRPLCYEVLEHFGLPRWLSGKKFSCNAGATGDWGWIPGEGRPPWSRKWQATPAFLPGTSHGQRSLGQATVHGVAKSWTRPSNWAYTHWSTLCIYEGDLEKKERLKLKKRKDRIVGAKTLRQAGSQSTRKRISLIREREHSIIWKGREAECVGTKQLEYESYGQEDKAFLIMSLLFS